MSKPSILIIAPFPPPIHGSAVVSQQIRESKIINKTFTCDFVNISTSRRIEEIGRKTPKKYIRFIESYLLLFWKLLTNRYNLCYLAITCHGKGFLKDAPFVLLCKLFGKKIVIHQHNKGMSEDIGKSHYKRLLKLAYKDAKVIILSQRLYPDIQDIVTNRDVFVCPNGIEPNDNISQDQHKRNDKTTRILFLSNLLKQKGILVLLDALKVVQIQGFSFICDFVGNESNEFNRSTFQDEVDKRGLQEIVFFHGRKMGVEKEHFFLSSDIFVFPSLNEAFGLVLLEAMKYKLPIIASNEGGIPDIVVDNINGILTQKGDVKGIASALTKLIEDKALRTSMGERGRELFEQKFTQDIFERNLCEILNKCIHA